MRAARRLGATVSSGSLTTAQVLSRAYLTAMGAVLLWSLAPVVAGWSSVVVVSGSMAPALVAGDVVAAAPIRPADLRPGHVLVVVDPAQPDRLLTHRLLEVTPAGLTTKGDANLVADSTPVPVQHLRGVARLRIPYAGVPALWWRSGRYGPLAGWMALNLVAIVCAGADVGARTAAAPPPGTQRQDGTGRLPSASPSSAGRCGSSSATAAPKTQVSSRTSSR